MTTSPHQSTGTILLVGASRGLGLAMAGQFARKGWRVIGTVRGHDRTALHDLAKAHPGQISIEPLDITAPDQLARLRTVSREKRSTSCSSMPASPAPGPRRPSARSPPTNSSA
jgi:NAD(P)-dependent dehydrogenase (short-subunit alcohol dehydrogenase family)